MISRFNTKKRIWQYAVTFMPIVRRHLAVISAVAAIGLVIVGMVRLQLESTRTARVAVLHTHAVLHTIDRLYAEILNAESSQRGFIVTGSKE
ncbi:MAG: hypothetical protein FJX23_08110, partial [Alphaproteobacteria bacterium]|nr:hypothetical protein [Alphaproteobacteria bacterium]